MQFVRRLVSKVKGPSSRRVITVVIGFSSIACSLPSRAAEQLNPTEKWIVEQVTAGRVADLKKQFQEDKDRTVGGQFLENLLAGALVATKSHRNGIRIRGATVDQPINLRNARIPTEVWLDDCIFVSNVNFAYASVDGTLTFDGTTFKADAIFNSVKIRSTASFRAAIFEGAANLNGAEISGDFLGNKAEFKNKESGASFSRMKIGGGISCQNAVFEGPVSFIATVTGDNFHAADTHFNSKKYAANFNSIKIGRTAFFDRAVFEGAVDFVTADIASVFTADEAKFNNREGDAVFYGMKVAGFASFRKVVFEGAAVFDLADIGGHFIADETQFINKSKASTFDGLKVRGIVYFRRVAVGSISLKDTSFLDLVIDGANSNTARISQLDLSRCSIKRQLSIRTIRIDDLIAPSLRVEGSRGFDQHHGYALNQSK